MDYSLVTKPKTYTQWKENIWLQTHIPWQKNIGSDLLLSTTENFILLSTWEVFRPKKYYTVRTKESAESST